MGQRDDSAGRPRSLGWVAVIGIAAGLLLGLGPSLGQRFFDRGPSEHLSIDDLPPGGQVDVAALSMAHAAPAPASPGGTVQAFVDALANDDADRSFELLSLADRGRFRSVGAWNTARLQMFGSIEAVAIERDGGEATETTLTLESTLSEVAGLTPRTLHVSWSTVEESGWRIQLGESLAEPEFPDEGSAPGAAVAWLSSDGACSDAGRRDADVLRGDARAHDALCANSTEVSIGTEVAAADPLTIAALSSRFGPDADSWARTVSVSGPFTGRLLLAPIGESWVVIDVLAAPAS